MTGICEPHAEGLINRLGEDLKVVFIGAGIGIGEVCEGSG